MGKLWIRTFPTSVRTFRTTAKHLRLLVASPGWQGVEDSLPRLRPRAQLHVCQHYLPPLHIRCGQLQQSP
jgi:hypothetical protein